MNSNFELIYLSPMQASTGYALRSVPIPASLQTMAIHATVSRQLEKRKKLRYKVRVKISFF